MPIQSFQIDFSQVEDFAPLDAGNYPVVIDHVEVREGKDSGVPYLNWEAIISEGEAEGRHVFFITSLGEKSLWRLKALLNTLGVLEESMDFVVDEDTSYLIQPDLSGIAAIAVVKQEVYEGKVRDRVEDFIAPSETFSKPVSAVSAASAKPPIGTAPKAATPALASKGPVPKPAVKPGGKLNLK